MKKWYIALGVLAISLFIGVFLGNTDTYSSPTPTPSSKLNQSASVIESDILQEIPNREEEVNKKTQEESTQSSAPIEFPKKETSTSEPTTFVPTSPSNLSPVTEPSGGGDIEEQGSQQTSQLSVPAPEETTTQTTENCHPSYSGACLKPDASDYDCAGGSGNGPYYTGTIRVIGPDVFGLDRDHDGWGCE